MSLIFLSNDKCMSKSRFLLELPFPDRKLSLWLNPNIVPMVSSFCKIHVNWENDCLDKSMCNIETLEKLNSDPFHFSDIEYHHKSYPYPVSIFEKFKCRCLVTQVSAWGKCAGQCASSCQMCLCLGSVWMFWLNVLVSVFLHGFLQWYQHLAMFLEDYLSPIVMDAIWVIGADIV